METEDGCFMSTTDTTPQLHL